MARQTKHKAPSNSAQNGSPTEQEQQAPKLHLKPATLQLVTGSHLPHQKYLQDNQTPHRQRTQRHNVTA